MISPVAITALRSAPRGGIRSSRKRSATRPGPIPRRTRRRRDTAAPTPPPHRGVAVVLMETPVEPEVVEVLLRLPGRTGAGVNRGVGAEVPLAYIGDLSKPQVAPPQGGLEAEKAGGPRSSGR